MAEGLPPQADDDQPSSATKHAAAASHIPAPAKRKGIILGPDGKPCRSCNTYQDFFSATRGATAAAAASVPKTAPRECPPDVEQLGRASWTLLHSIAAAYPSRASPAQQQDMSQFLRIFARIYPCWSCAADFRSWMARPGNADLAAVVRGRATLGRWLCDAHNDVNAKLGKKLFDCSKWEERWRTGGEGC